MTIFASLWPLAILAALLLAVMTGASSSSLSVDSRAEGLLALFPFILLSSSVAAFKLLSLVTNSEGDESLDADDMV